MSIFTKLGNFARAKGTDFDPRTAVPASDVQAAIEYLATQITLDADLVAIAALSPANDDVIQRKAGAWTNRTMAQLIADLAALGTTFQPKDTELTAIAALTPADGAFIVGDGATWVTESGNTARTSLGLGTTNTPQWAGFNIVATSTPFNSDPASAYFGTYEGATAALLTLTQAEVQAADESGGWRSALTIYHQDNDLTDYEAMVYRTISDGLRVAAFGKNDGAGTYTENFKDVHGITSSAVARTGWAERGVAAFAGESVQMGEGVCLNEVSVSNPSGAGAQSGQVIGWLVNLYAKKAAADASHVVYGFAVQNIGKLATAAFSATSNGTEGDNGRYKHLLYGSGATVDTAAIVMPDSASGNVGSYIVYDTGDFTHYDKAGNAYIWAIGSTNRIQMDAATFFPSTNDGAALGYATLAWSDVFLASGGVINFNNGNYTLTHAAGALTAAGGPFTAPSFVPSGSTVPTNGTYLPAANTLGWAINSAAELQLTATALSPAVSDGNALGTTSLMWGDLFLASGGVINWDAGDVTITHSANALSFAGASSGYTFDDDIIIDNASPRIYFHTDDYFHYNQGGNSFQFAIANVNRLAIDAGTIFPTTNDGAALGYATLSWSDLFLASGAVVNYANGDYTVTHSTGKLAFSSQISVPNVNTGGTGGLHNFLLNGCMRINQRAKASNADDTFAFDRWNILTQTGTVAVSQLTDVENGTPYMMRITQSQASAQRFGVAQMIEARDCKRLRGAQVTLYARVRCSNSTTLRYAIIEWTGTADSITSDFVNDWTSGTFTAGNFFTSTSTTVTGTGSIALTANTLTDITALTVTLGSSLNNVTVMFWTDSTQAQNSTLDIGKVGLVFGDKQTTFEYRPYAVEFNASLRFYQKLGLQVAKISSATTGRSYGNWLAPMRTTPSITLVAGTAGITDPGTADYDISAISISTATNTYGVLDFTKSSGGSAGTVMFTTPTLDVDVSAEL